MGKARKMMVACRTAAGLAAAAAALAACSTAGRAADVLVVDINRAKIIRLPAKAQTLIIGNPIIADVTLLKGGNNVVVTGKGFGETNLVVLDTDGNLLTEETIQVKANSRSTLIVQRGTERESYSCAPRCEPTVQLGDGPTFFPATSGEITSRNSLAAAATAKH